MKKRRGQIWVETVLYTLIGLALIGAVLALATPKINEAKDRAVIEQSVDSLNVLDGKIRDVLDKGDGNIRKVELLTLKRGKLTINPLNDNIVFFIDGLEKPYSEPGVAIEVGSIKITSEEGAKKSTVSLELNYSSSFNLTYNGGEEIRSFTAASIPYSFSFENKGVSGDLIIVDVKETSRE